MVDGVLRSNELLRWLNNSARPLWKSSKILRVLEVLGEGGR